MRQVQIEWELFTKYKRSPTGAEWDEDVDASFENSGLLPEAC